MKLFVAGLPYDLFDDELVEIFEKFGPLVSAKVTMDRETGKSRGFGFVEMSSDTAGNEAINKLNGAIVEGRAMSVNVARPKEKNSNARFF